MVWSLLRTAHCKEMEKEMEDRRSSGCGEKEETFRLPGTRSASQPPARH